MASARSRLIAMLVTAAAILAAGAAISSATQTVRIRSKISISDKALTFKGRVSSRNAACVAHRKVILFRATGLKLGTTHTNSTGHWKITISGFAGVSLGHYFARVTRRAEGTAGTIFVCRAATSPTIPFSQ